MNRELLFGLIGAILFLITFLIALKAIFAGDFKPHRVTYGIFVLITTVTFFNQIINGGGYSSYFLGVSLFSVSIIFGLSFRFGMGGSSNLDKATLVSALILTVYWLISQDSRYSTIVAIVIDLVALVPTIHKAFNFPKTEIYLNWLISGIGGLLSIFAISESDWILFIFPIYLFFGNLLVVFAKYFGTRNQRKISPNTT
ncbi:MAG TPA: hypothetical protein PLT55_01815 [Acidimicrobiia bacterium]|nr:hypothetical protein [Acidimicrobiia bacterium]